MALIEKIKKRSGDIVDFDLAKIKSAIYKAFTGNQELVSDEKLIIITEHVLKHLEKLFFDKIPQVEDVQDIVEKVLQEEGFFEVAKAYILYRYEHAKVREEKQKILLEKIQKNNFYLIKKSGKREKFSQNKLKKSLSYATKGLESEVEIEQILSQCLSELYEQINTEDLSLALVMAARSFIEKNYAYAKVSARLLLGLIYKKTIDKDVFKGADFKMQYRNAFMRNLKNGVEIGRLDQRLLDFDLKKLSEKLQYERDDLLLYMGLQTLYDRYFLRNPETKEILETPQMMWMRIAMGLSLLEDDKEGRAVCFYDEISSLRFVPSTPTLFHAGTTHPQLSSCYLTTINDSLDHIFKCVADNAQLSKWSGGLGNDWSNIRGTGSLIKGTGVESQGVIPFLKIANDTTVAINRSGRRRGATCAYLEVWHLDIEDFLELRKNTGDERRRTHDMNTANWIPDLFMKRVQEYGDWTLFSPDETSDLHHLYGKKFEERYIEYEKMTISGKIKLFKRIKAVDLWKKMVTMLFETGHPWLTFKDPCNIRSPQDHVGVIHSSNLCTEITLNTSEDETAVCNLGSLNLARFVNKGQLDHELIKLTVETAVRMLDNVIDINFYPTEEAKNSNLKHRPIGLGIMGFQDALFMLNINFESDAAVDFADRSMELISFYAIKASAQLAKERGFYATFKGSKWDRGIFPFDTISILENERGEQLTINKILTLDWNELKSMVKKWGLRNSNIMAIAPTATISNIAGCFPSIEPIYKNIYVKSNMSGEFVVINPYLIDDLKKLGLWNQDMLDEIKGNDGNIQDFAIIPRDLREKYKEAFDIDPHWYIKIAAHRGKWIDQSQSLNFYIKSNSGRFFSDVYMDAWKMGLKTTYYLRTLAASSIEKSTLSLMKQRTHQGSDNMHVLSESKVCAINEPSCEVCQ